MSLGFTLNSSNPVGQSRLLHPALLALFFIWSAAAQAHPSPFSYFDLRLSQSRLEGALVVHVIDLAHDLNVSPAESLLNLELAESKKEDIISLLRSRLTLSADGRALDFELRRIEVLTDQQALALHLRFPSSGSPGALSIHCLLFPSDPQHQTFLNVYEEEALVDQEILNRDKPSLEHFTGNRQGVLAIVKKFLLAGIYHILAGPDHILFIVGLLLLRGGLLRLLSIVTAFTLAHSITLSLAALDVVNLPAWLIEPAIALSIIYVGIDNLMIGKAGRDVRAWVAFFFGLVHGFGFAGVLREFGLPRQALGWSLFSFNFGVEIGQAWIVVVVAGLLAAVSNHNQELGRRVATVGSVGVILAGSYWFIQRVFY